MTTADVISHYRTLGWTFKQVSWPTTWRSDKSAGATRSGGGVEVAWYVTSPHTDGECFLIADDFEESELVGAEAAWLTNRQRAWELAETRMRKAVKTPAQVAAAA